MKNSSNIENGQLYPNMIENPQLRWGFIRKVYSIIAIQVLITIGVSAFMFFSPPIKGFIRTWPGIGTIMAVFIFTLIISCTMTCWGRRHPWNYIMMFIFTAGMAFLIGCICAYKKGETVLVGAGLTAIVTVALTIYTFWAASRGKDFSFLAPFLMCALIILIAFAFLRMFFPFGGTMSVVYGCIGSLVFSGFIIYDTDNLIKRFSYDEYIAAAVTLYIDILNLYSCILGAMDAAD
ncbi:hypothetical protein Leryth_017529 [Lithospermum erythrorhizon]|nr:hypothetical protein Leryth_017529 [Lithospermum erythrorhizon]